jgi:hypothetical protein
MTRSAWRRIAPERGRGALAGEQVVVASLLLVLALLVLPSGNVVEFDGIPASSAHEVVALLLLLPLCLSRGLRRGWSTLLQRHGGRVGLVLLAMVGLALAGKLALTLTEAHEGFAACYVSPAAPPAAACESSFENPLGLLSRTRIDEQIRFGPSVGDSADAIDPAYAGLAVSGPLSRSNWNLGFLNSIQFNVLHPQEPGSRERSRLPLAAHWTGVIDADQGTRPVLRYAGEGRVTIDGATVPLPASYASVRKQPLAVGPGRHAFTLDYAFTRMGVVGRGSTGPYAQVELIDAETTKPLHAAAPVFWKGVLAVVVDAAAFVALLCMAFAWLLAARGLGPYAALAGGWALLALWQPDQLGLPTSATFIVVTAATGIVLAWKRPPHATAFAFVGFVALACAQASTAFPSVNSVLYREGGTDFIAYETFARDIFQTGSLHGGEDVFYWQAGHRYILAAQRFLLGEGDLLISASSQVAMNFAVFLLVLVALRRSAQSRVASAIVALTGVCLYLLLNSETLLSLIRLGVSEGATWATLPAGAALLWSGAGLGALVGGAALIALTWLTRMNQAPGLILILASLLPTSLRARRRAAAVAVGVFLIIVLAIPAHNVIFGGRLTLLPTSADVTVSFSLRPEQLTDVPSDPAARDVFLDQVARTFYFDPAKDFPTRVAPYSGALAVVFHTIQFLWIGAAALAVAYWRRAGWRSLGLLLAPLALLLPFLFYNAIIYYPRHQVAGHIAMAIAVLYVVATCLGPGPPTIGGGRIESRLRTAARLPSMPPRRLRWVLAALAFLACAAGIQAGVLSAPIALGPATPITGSSNRIVGYRLEPRTVRSGQPVRLTLFFERAPVHDAVPKVSLVRTGVWGRVDPVVAPTVPPFLDTESPVMTVEVVPRVSPGTYKLRLGRGRAFGLLRVTS